MCKSLLNIFTLTRYSISLCLTHPRAFSLDESLEGPLHILLGLHHYENSLYFFWCWIPCCCCSPSLWNTSSSSSIRERVRNLGDLCIRTYLPIWIVELTSWENLSYKELEDGIAPVSLLSGFFLLKVWWKSTICDHFCLQVLKCCADMLCWGLHSPVALVTQWFLSLWETEVLSSRKVSWIFSLTTCLLLHYFLSRAFYFWWGVTFWFFTCIFFPLFIFKIFSLIF